jgi:hypothetical protein
MKKGDILICIDPVGVLILDKEYEYIKEDYYDYITIKDTSTNKMIEGYHKKRFKEK